MAEQSQSASSLRCITCHKLYEGGSKSIHSRLPAFDDWCVCWECVDLCQKRGPAPDLKGGD